jgi:WD40 repeat protein
MALAFNRGGDLLASSSWDNTVRLWDPWTGKLLLTHPASVGTLAFDRDDGRLAGVGDPQAWVWRVADRRALRTLHGAPVSGDSHRPWSVEFSPNGALLAVGETDGVQLWDVAAGREVAFLPGGTRSVLFSPDGKSLVTCCHTLQRWPISAALGGADEERRIGPPQSFATRAPDGFLAASQSRDGGVLAAVGLSWDARGRMDHAAYLFRRQGEPKPVQLRGQPAMEKIAVSPDGRWIATAPWQGTGARVWDARTGRSICDLPLRLKVTPRFSPDGKWLVTGTAQEYRFWEAGSWRPGLAFPRDPGAGYPGVCAFTRDGRVFALAHSASALRLIDLATRQEIATLEAPDSGELSDLAFSPDGVLLAGSVYLGSHVQLWNLRLIRQRLAAMKLDWDLPPYPPVRRQEGRTPLRFRVVQDRP